MHVLAIKLAILGILLVTQLQSETHAQAACTLPPRLSTHMPGRVRAVENSIQNLRASASLTAEIIGELANNSEFIVQSAPACADGLNWYEVETLDGTSGWTAEGKAGLYWLEPTPFCTNLQRAANITRYILDHESGVSFSKLINVEYIPAQQSLLIASAPPNFERSFDEPPHPARLDYYWFNLKTQTLTSTEYPDADLVTPALTDTLGITNYVFGDKSREFYSLHISPQRDRILYFTDNPPIENCAHGCYTAQVWVADVDGSNPVEVGTLIMGDAGYINWEWGQNGRIYLTMIYIDGSYGIVEICDDGSCFNRPEQAFPYNNAFPSVSPDGEQLTVVRMGDDNTIFGHQRLIHSASNTWVDLKLPGWVTPTVWSEDGQTIYALGWFNNKIVLTSTQIDHLDQVEILVDDVRGGYDSAWGVVPDFGLAFIGEPYSGLVIYCMPV